MSLINVRSLFVRPGRRNELAWKGGSRQSKHLRANSIDTPPARFDSREASYTLDQRRRAFTRNIHRGGRARAEGGGQRREIQHTAFALARDKGAAAARGLSRSARSLRPAAATAPRRRRRRRRQRRVHRGKRFRPLQS